MTRHLLTILFLSFGWAVFAQETTEATKAPNADGVKITIPAEPDAAQLDVAAELPPEGKDIVEIQPQPPVDVVEAEDSLVAQVKPTLLKFFDKNFIMLAASQRYISHFVPMAQETARLKKVQLPGFQKNVWMPASTQKTIGFVERQQPYTTLMVVVYQSVKEQYLEILKRDLEYETGTLDFENRDILKVLAIDEADSPDSLSLRSAQGTGIPKEVETEVSQHLLAARQAFFDGNLQQALDALTEASHLAPKSPQVYEMLGSLYYTLNWKRLALQKWQRALELDPTNQKLTTYLERLKREQ